MDLFLRASISCGCFLPTDVSVLRQLLENIAQDYMNLYFSKKSFSIISLGAWKGWAPKEWLLQVFIVATYPVGKSDTEHKKQSCQMVFKLKQRPRKAALHAKISAVKKKNLCIFLFSDVTCISSLLLTSTTYLNYRSTRICWDPANLRKVPKWDGLLLELEVIYWDVHVHISKGTD